MSESIPVSCQCGASMGRMVQVDNEIYLDDGVFLVSSGRKICHACGRPFHFRRPQQPWRALVQRHQNALAGSGAGG